MAEDNFNEPDLCAETTQRIFFVPGPSTCVASEVFFRVVRVVRVFRGRLPSLV